MFGNLSFLADAAAADMSSDDDSQDNYDNKNDDTHGIVANTSGASSGYDPDREYLSQEIDFPVHSINQQVRKFQDDITERIISHFQDSGISEAVLRHLSIGYNGRYVVYPYFQEDGNCYSARCVYPDRPEDNFWHGDDAVTAEQKPTVAILIAISPNGEIWIDKKRVDPTTVRAHIEKLHAENPKGGLVIQADKQSTNEKLMAVLNAARAAGMREVAISTEKN